jgi:hypothetical protein
MREVLFVNQEEKKMFELLAIVIFVWLLVKSIGFMFKLTWGAAKIIAAILITLAFPVLFVSLIFAGGIALLAPLVIIAIAAGILKACL